MQQSEKDVEYFLLFISKFGRFRFVGRYNQALG